MKGSNHLRLINYFLCLLSVLSFIYLELYSITVGSLWLDEFATWWIVKQEPFQALYQSGPFPNHPAYYFLVSIIVMLFGDSEVALRALSVVSILLSIVCAYRLTSLFQHSLERINSLLAVLLSLCFFWDLFNHSIEARPYAFGIVLVLLSWIQFQKGKLVYGYFITAFATLVHPALWLGVFFVFVDPDSSKSIRAIFRTLLYCALSFSPGLLFSLITIIPRFHDAYRFTVPLVTTDIAKDLFLKLICFGGLLVIVQFLHRQSKSVSSYEQVLFKKQSRYLFTLFLLTIVPYICIVTASLLFGVNFSLKRYMVVTILAGWLLFSQVIAALVRKYKLLGPVCGCLILMLIAQFYLINRDIFSRESTWKIASIEAVQKIESLPECDSLKLFVDVAHPESLQAEWLKNEEIREAWVSSISYYLKRFNERRIKLAPAGDLLFGERIFNPRCTFLVSDNFTAVKNYKDLFIFNSSPEKNILRLLSAQEKRKLAQEASRTALGGKLEIVGTS